MLINAKTEGKTWDKLFQTAYLQYYICSNDNNKLKNELI